jgi:adenylate cyclase class 2
MPVEIEAKMRVDDLDAVRARLRKFGARLVGDYLESNIFFDRPKRSLLKRGSGLRLRRMRDQRTHKDTNVITYKGKLQRGRLKTREEIETSVEDFDATIALLEAIGFQQMLLFEKKRQSWKLDDCEIELDELPHIGRFVEIEGPGERAVMKVREKLELDDVALVKTGYASMVASLLRSRKPPSKVLRFSR